MTREEHCQIIVFPDHAFQEHMDDPPENMGAARSELSA